MKTLLESGIRQEILDELENALIEQNSLRIDEMVYGFRLKLMEKGYSEEEITTSIKLRTYSDLALLDVICKTPDGASLVTSTANINFLEVSSNNLKCTNLVIKKIKSYYKFKEIEEIEAINEGINKLSDNNVKFVQYYNEPRINFKGVDYAKSGSYYYYEISYNTRNKQIPIEGVQLEKINNLVSAYKSKIEANVQAEKEAAEAKKEELKAWALQNGSALLIARIEEGFNWFDLSNEEYQQSIMPDGWGYADEDEYDSCWDYNNPTFEHIMALREARKNNIFESVMLRKCRITDEYGDTKFDYLLVADIKKFNDDSDFQVSKIIDTEFVSNYED